MSLVPPFMTRMLEWLRAGYPDGVPRGDYVALLGILHRRLTDAEVEAIADELAEAAEKDDQPVSKDDIRDMIREHVFLQASKKDVARVSAHLAAGGWPLATGDEESGANDANG